jgi:DNA-binding NarL/FixJ family response regulator
VVDDHDIVRIGLAQILEDESDIKIVGEAKNGLEAINRALELKPDVIIMDILLPGCSGLEATVAIKEKWPEAKVLIWTMSEREEDMLQALKFGAQGYLLKCATVTEMVEAVRRTAAGETMLSSRMASKLAAEFRNRDKTPPNLSSREMDVLLLVTEGLTDTNIGERLFITETTVRTHLRRLLDKLHLKNRVQAAAYAARLNLKDRQL